MKGDQPGWPRSAGSTDGVLFACALWGVSSTSMKMRKSTT